MLKAISKYLSIVLLTMLLSACGFHLRGNTPIPSDLNTLYIQSKRPYDTLSKSLHQQLQTAGVTIATTPKDAPVTLKIISEANSQSLGNIGTNTTTRVYALHYEAKFALYNSKGKQLAGPYAVTETRSFATSSNQILSYSTAQVELKNEMAAAAANQVLNILVAPSTQAKLQKNLGVKEKKASTPKKVPKPF